MRTALEGSQSITVGNRLSLTPSVEVGLRQDGGDAETGAGMDVGGGLAFNDTVTGLSLDVRVRTLLVHQAEGFTDRGVSLSFGWDPSPSSPLGLTARIAPTWGGQAMGGAEALWNSQMAYGAGAPGVRSRRLRQRRDRLRPAGRRPLRRSASDRGYRPEPCRVEGRRVTGRESVACPALSQPGRSPKPVGTFPPPALRTRRADFRHRALQWNHTARTRVPGHGERMGLASCGTQLAPVRRTGRGVVRPVYALATATARVVPFACACDDVRHSCSSAGY